MNRLISGFSAIWTRGISDYGDKRKETWAADQKRGGHWEYRKHSEGATPDKPIPVFIDSRQKQKEFIKAEKLIDPNEIGNISMDSEGRSFSSGSGMPGAWI